MDTREGMLLPAGFVAIGGGADAFVAGGRGWAAEAGAGLVASVGGALPSGFVGSVMEKARTMDNVILHRIDGR